VTTLGSGAVRLGLFAINYGTCADPATAVRVAQHAEAAGLESVWTGEHLALPAPQPEGFAIAPTVPFLDTIVALTLVAASTSSIAVASGIIELPLHHPVTLAKQLASIDHVAGGRLIVGLGAGYVEAEFAAMGVPLAERGRRMDEHLDAMRELWSSEHPEYHGRFVDFAGIDAQPRPRRASGPSIVLGGVSDGARRRAVMKADGWYVFNTTRELAREAVDVIAADQQRYDRRAELGPLEITMTPVGHLDRAVVEWYEELGVDRLVLLPRSNAARARRHEPVALDDILRTIDAAATWLS
jgi:probable F420-dependent oxidoreductase